MLYGSCVTFKVFIAVGFNLNGIIFAKQFLAPSEFDRLDLKSVII